MHSESIGSYAWNDDEMEGTNDWSTSPLKNMLNEGGDYYSELENKNIKTIEFISDALWYYNSHDDELVYPNEIYNYERNGDKTWNGEIALIYLSDYGYSYDLNLCDSTISVQESSTCEYSTWMKDLIYVSDDYGETGSLAWALMPSYSTDNAWGFYSNGRGVSYDFSVYSHFNVFPSLYLNADVKFNSFGDGSSGTPYQLLVN